MAHNLTIKPEAEYDMTDAMFWQEEQKRGLGLELLNEFREVISYIHEFPEHSQKRYRNVHIRFTKKFKYGIHYIIEEDNIYVLAVLHTSRKPKQ